MPNYYFQLRSPQHTVGLDEGPRNLPSLTAALAEAQAKARSMIHNHVRRAPHALRGTLDIEDERRQPVARILLADIARQIS